MFMVRAAHEVAVDELCAHIGVNDTNDESRYDDEGKAGLLVHNWSKTAEGWCSGVLAKEVEADCWRNDEKDG